MEQMTADQIADFLKGAGFGKEVSILCVGRTESGQIEGKEFRLVDVILVAKTLIVFSGGRKRTVGAWVRDGKTMYVLEEVSGSWFVRPKEEKDRTWLRKIKAVGQRH